MQVASTPWGEHSTTAAYHEMLEACGAGADRRAAHQAQRILRLIKDCIPWHRCGSRACSDCGPKKARKNRQLLQTQLRAVEHRGNLVQHWVLTCPSWRLDEGVCAIRTAARELRRTAFWKQTVVGGWTMLHLEPVVTEGSFRWNVHFHVLVELAPSAQVDEMALHDHWGRLLSGAGSSTPGYVKVHPVDEFWGRDEEPGGFSGIAFYVTAVRPSKWVEHGASTMTTIFEVMHRRRFGGFVGSWITQTRGSRRTRRQQPPQGSSATDAAADVRPQEGTPAASVPEQAPTPADHHSSKPQWHGTTGRRASTASRRQPQAGGNRSEASGTGQSAASPVPGKPSGPRTNVAAECMRPASELPIPSRRRVRAVLALRGQTLSQLTTLLAVSERHLTRVLDGERRPSVTLLDALRRALGEQAWLFVLGVTSDVAAIESSDDHVRGPPSGVATPTPRGAT